MLKFLISTYEKQYKYLLSAPGLTKSHQIKSSVV